MRRGGAYRDTAAGAARVAARGTRSDGEECDLGCPTAPRNDIIILLLLFRLSLSLARTLSLSLTPSRSPRPRPRVNLAATAAAHGSVSSGPTVSHGPPDSVRAIIMFFFFCSFPLVLRGVCRHR